MPFRLPSSRRRTLLATGALATVAALGACRKPVVDVADSDDPIAALKVTTPTRRYTQGFWTAQAQSSDSARRRLWGEALAYCRRPDLEVDGAKPNCREVMTAAALYHDPHGSAATGGQMF